jgi:hypothetical protein
MLLLAIEIASASVSNEMIESTGPKISSLAIELCNGTFLKIVGSM